MSEGLEGMKGEGVEEGIETISCSLGPNTFFFFFCLTLILKIVIFFYFTNKETGLHVVNIIHIGTKL